MDIFDHAQEVERRIREEAIARAGSNANRNAVPSREACEECGESIPLARRKAVAGCTLCVVCQNEKEQSR